jgi:hypothetical protein
MDFTVTIPAPERDIGDRRPDKCEWCGSLGFNIHGRALRAVKSPGAPPIEVVRYICKRCRRTTRMYPAGIDSTRQSHSLRKASVLAYWLGMPYQSVQTLAKFLGAPLSKATIWANARDAGLLSDRHRVRADPGTVEVRPDSMGVFVRFAVRRRWVSMSVATCHGGAIIFTIGSIQPEAARLMHRRAVEAGRRLRLTVARSEDESSAKRA